MMQQLVFTREFFVLLDAVKIGNMQYLEKKDTVHLKDCYRKSPNKKSLKYEF